MIGEYYTVIDVAKKYRINPDTVRQWIREQKLPAVMINRAYMIKAADFERWIDQKGKKNVKAVQ